MTQPHPLRAYVQHLSTCEKNCAAWDDYDGITCTCGLDLALSRSEQDEEQKTWTRVDAMGTSTDSPTAASHEAAPCALCGSAESKDGDWYRLCGPCRWVSMEHAWKPIETVPSGDADFIIGSWWIGDEREVGELSRERHEWYDINCSRQQPTHWIPLPTPPEAGIHRCT